MIGRRLLAFGRGLTSGLTLAAVLVVPPACLGRFVGWPLPTDIPRWEAVSESLRGGVPDSFIVKLLAVLLWIAWLQVAAAMVIEVHAAVRGRSARRLPLLPGVQASIRRLVAGVAMASASVHSIAAPVSAVPHPSVVVAAEVPEGSAALMPPVPQGGDVRATPAPESLPTVTVERHDTLWGIAQRTLGDGARWTEIRALNVGRTMPDGSQFDGSTEIIREGWVLVLPSDARRAAPAGPSPQMPVSQSGGEVTVEPGDNLWSIAAAQVTTDLGRTPTEEEVRGYWLTLTEANRDRLPSADQPDRIFAGQVLATPPTDFAVATERKAPQPSPSSALPPTPGESGRPAPSPPGESQPAPQPGSDAASVPARTEARSNDDRRATSQDGDPELPLPVLIVGGGLASVVLATGVRRAVERRRRRYAYTHPGRVSVPTHDDHRALHHQAVVQSDGDTVENLRNLLGHLACQLASTGCDARPRVVLQTATCIDVLLAGGQPGEPPEGWTAADREGAVWTHALAASEGGADPGCASPLLVTLGQPEQGEQLYLDLEGEGSIALTGDMDVARNLARSIITEVALSPLSDAVQLTVVGDLVDSEAARLGHVAVVDGWDAIATDLLAWVEQSHEAFAMNQWSNAFLARGEQPEHEALAPWLVVAASEPPAEVVETIRRHRPAALAVVTVGDADLETQIRCQQDMLTLSGLDLTCSPQAVDPQELTSIVVLLDTADEGEAVTDTPSDPRPAHHGDRTEWPAVSPDGQGQALERNEAESDGATRDAAGGATGQSEAIPPLVAAVKDDGRLPLDDEEMPATEGECDVLVRVLGEVAIEGLRRPLSPKLTAVVAYIAVRRSVSAERLEDACWGGEAAATSRGRRVKDAATRARAAVGSANLPIASEGTYRAGRGLLTDAHLFEQRIAGAPEEPAARAEAYRAALDLVTGPVFSYPSAAAGSFGWIDTENLVQRWEVRIAQVAQQCADLYLTLGDPEAAVTVALSALDALPMHAGLTETLMRAHAARGDLRAVRQTYTAYLSAVDALGVDDDAGSMTALYLQLCPATSEAS